MTEWVEIESSEMQKRWGFNADDVRVFEQKSVGCVFLWKDEKREISFSHTLLNIEAIEFATKKWKEIWGVK